VQVTFCSAPPAVLTLKSLSGCPYGHPERDFNVSTADLVDFVEKLAIFFVLYYTRLHFHSGPVKPFLRFLFTHGTQRVGRRLPYAQGTFV
jgi:hypothetical protein